MNWALLSLVLAFPAPAKFDLPGINGGGGGKRFTGSPRQRYDCGVCHVGEVAKLSFTAAGDSPVSGYVAGKSYDLDLSIDGEAKAANVAVEVLDAKGAPAGTLANATGLPAEYLCTDGTDPLELRDGATVAIARSCRQGLKSWRVRWTAPDPAVGPVTLYAAGVDGNLDGAVRGDRAGWVQMGFKAPGAAADPNPGACSGGTSGALVLPFLGLLFARRRNATLLLLLLVLAAPSAFAAGKKKSKAKPAPVEAPVTEPAHEEPVEAPAPAPAEPVAAPAPVHAESVEAPAPAPEEPTAPNAELWVGPGFGARSFTAVSGSFAEPLRLSPAWPEIQIGLTAYPLRWTKVSALGGIFLQGRYGRGWVIAGTALGPEEADRTRTLPFRASTELGYRLELGPVVIAPAATYAFSYGGVERNPVFIDPVYHDVGGTLTLGVHFGDFMAELSPRFAFVVYAGDDTRDWGALRSGRTFGGDLLVRWKFSKKGFSAALRYRVHALWSTFAGGGDTASEPVSTSDVTQGGAVLLEYAL
jgi:hypothetical protein